MGRAIDRPGLGAARLGAFALFAVAAGHNAAAQDALVATPPPAEVPATPPVAQLPEAVPPPSAPAAPAPPGTPQCPPPAADAGPCIPALTPVKLLLRTHLGSTLSTSGQSFAFELAEPLVVDGKVLLPAGTPGMGEVVHAKKSGGLGAAGELVLAARYLVVGARQLRLRSMNFAVAGQEKIGTSNTVALVSAATVPVIAFASFFIKGKAIDIPEGALAQAKTAEPFVLDPPVESAPEAPAAPVLPPAEQGTTP